MDHLQSFKQVIGVYTKIVIRRGPGVDIEINVVKLKNMGEGGPAQV